MIDHWQRTKVTGHWIEGMTETETVLHKRGDDMLGMAIKRNPALAGCSRFTMDTEEAFIQERAEDRRKTPEEIPRDDRQGEEYEW